MRPQYPTIPSINTPDPRPSLEGPQYAPVKQAHRIGKSQIGPDLVGFKIENYTPFAETTPGPFSLFFIYFLV